MNAMIIDEKDTVAVAIEPIHKGDAVTFLLSGKEEAVKALDEITIYHKIAVKEMKKGEPVVKYGEHIGLAVDTIAVGEHVHVHNVESHREDL